MQNLYDGGQPSYLTSLATDLHLDSPDTGTIEFVTWKWQMYITREEYAEFGRTGIEALLNQIELCFDRLIYPATAGAKDIVHLREEVSLLLHQVYKFCGIRARESTRREEMLNKQIRDLEANRNKILEWWTRQIFDETPSKDV